MVNAVSGLSSYQGAWSAVSSIRHPQAVWRTRGIMTAHRAASPETPVQPVRPADPVSRREVNPLVTAMPVWSENYAAEQAARFRIQYTGQGAGFSDNAQDQASAGTGASQDALYSVFPSDKAKGQAVFQAGLKGTADQPALSGSPDPAELAVRMRIQYVGPEAQVPGAEASAKESGKVQSEAQIGDVQEAGEKGKCETCERRKYQDGSDDMSVSYQTPTRISPEAAASAVRGHEMEHVAHEQARAQREDRKVVSQSVTLHTGICPECGKAYISGGTTRTVTKADPKPEVSMPQEDGRVFSA